MADVIPKSEPVCEVFPLLWSADVARLLEWGKAALGLTESWRAVGESGNVEHAELQWPGGRISINVQGDDYLGMGPSGISLRFDDRAMIDTTWKQAKAANADFVRDLEESRVAYSFTVVDPDGNQWWVNAETGFLDQLRQSPSDRAVSQVEFNRALGASINRDIWNNRKLELISEYFTEDFIADYSPRVVRQGHEGVRQMVEGAHAAFVDFKETVHSIVADENHVVVHFTISGRQVADWGPIRATGRKVEYPEIVIMRVREAKVCHQIGVSDALLALQQLGAIADPMGFARGWNSDGER